MSAHFRHAGLSCGDAGVTTHTDSNKDLAQTTRFMHFYEVVSQQAPLQQDLSTLQPKAWFAHFAMELLQGETEHMWTTQNHAYGP